MKTKIFTLLVMSIFLFSFMGVGVLADDGSHTQEISDEDKNFAIGDDDVGDSSGIWKDKMNRFFTFDKKKKAEIGMRIAKKRMHEAGELVEKHPEKAKVVAEKYGKELDSALENLDEIVLDGDQEEVIRALKRTVLIEFRLENHKAKVSEIHSRILENKADQMTEEQLTHLEEVFDNIEDKIKDSIDHVKQTQENLEARLLVLGVSEDRIAEALDHYEDFLEDRRGLRIQHLEEDRSLIEQRMGEIRDRLEASEDSIEELVDAREEIARARLKIAEAREDGEEVSAAEQRLEEARAKLLEAKAAFDAGNLEEAEELAEEAEKLASEARMKYLGKTIEEMEDDSDNSGSDSDDEEEDETDSELNDDGVIVLN